MKKQLIITILTSLAICLGLACSFVLISLIPSPTTPTGNNPAKQPPPPSITVPESITIELLSGPVIFEYTTTNISSYNVKIHIEDETIASISNNHITPLKIGETKIITTINCEPTITKSTTLIVEDCIKSVNLHIINEDESIPARYFTNTYYILKIEQNIIKENPSLNLENIKEINLIKTENNSYYYKFQINSYGNFSFVYNGKYVNKSIENYAYKLPTNFEINFNRNVNNSQINLYLFNNNYQSEANSNNLYNSLGFEIIKQQYSYDDIVLLDNYNHNIIEILNGTILAKSAGQTQISFYSNISKITKTFDVVVNEISLGSISVNGEPHNLGTIESIELTNISEFDFAFSYLPIYAICNLTLEYNENELTYENNKIKLNDNVTNSYLYIKNFDNVVYTLNIIKKIEIQESSVGHALTITYGTATLSSNTLNVNLSACTMLQLNCTAYDKTTNINLTIQNYSVEIKDTSICYLMSQEVSGGNIDLKFLKAGKTTLTITDLENDIVICIEIIVV